MRTARHRGLAMVLGCTLLSFDKTIGSTPIGTLVEAPDGSFYGTMSAGGTPNYGTIFKGTPSGVPTKVHEFQGVDGCVPMARMIIAPDGNFYGTTHKTAGCIGRISLRLDRGQYSAGGRRAWHDF